MNRDEEFYKEIWGVLVLQGGASLSEKDSFIHSSMDNKFPYTEYRFRGKLGFGGKFWRNDGRFYVSYYLEDKSEERDKIVDNINQKIDELVKKYNPKIKL